MKSYLSTNYLLKYENFQAFLKMPISVLKEKETGVMECDNKIKLYVYFF